MPKNNDNGKELSIEKNAIKVIPLGGLGEIGKNIMCIEYQDQILIIDCGIKFPDDDMFGVDLVIPDLSYIVSNQEKLQGIILTHGHEDHIGAIPYLLSKLENPPPIYGGLLCLELVKSKMEEYSLLKVNNYDFRVIKTREEILIGNFIVEYIQTSHSISDSYAIAITTDIGTIIHTGDFKVDHTPIDGKIFDFYKFASFGEKGVLALFSDSTNVEREGISPSEKELGDKFRNAIINNKGRTIIATFSTNIHRIQQVIDVAVELGKQVALSGRSMEKVVNIALQHGYLRIPMGVLINISEIKDLPRDKVIVVTTGTQGEPMSALYLLARESHRWFDLKSEDTVIISASVIPGNEKTVSKIVNTLFRTGATIIYKDFGNVHVSGHGHKEDLKIMLSLVKPKFFVPIHGEFRHLVHHAALAEEMGIKKSNILIAQDGDVIEITNESIRKASALDLQQILVDGKGVGDIGSKVLRDRQTLSEDGVVVVIISLNEAGLVGKPEVISRGFVYVKDNSDMIEEAKNIVENTVLEFLENKDKTNDNGKIDFTTIKTKIKSKLRTFFYSELERKPMLLIRILEN